jgi:hypothetical protein
MSEQITGMLRLDDRYGDLDIRGEHGELAAQCLLHRSEDARRLVACWNACAGLDTELLENIVMTGETLRSRFELLKQEIGESK